MPVLRDRGQHATAARGAVLRAVPTLHQGFSGARARTTARGVLEGLLGNIDAFPASSEVFKGALFLFRKDGAAEHPGGVAWPLYAILADGTTSGLEGNLKRLFGIAVPVNPESLSRDENVPHNVFVVGADVGVKSGSLTSTEIGEQATVGLLFERRMAVSLSPGRADTALHTG